MATNKLSTILAARFFLHPVLWLTRRARSFFVIVDKGAPPEPARSGWGPLRYRGRERTLVIGKYSFVGK
jgi:hypothetical protein